MSDLKSRLLKSSAERSIIIGTTLNITPIIARAHAATVAGNAVRAGIYRVTALALNEASHFATIRLRALCEDSDELDPSVPAQTMQATLGFMATHLGSSSVVVARSGQIVNELFKYQFAKGGKGALYNKDFDYDKLFKGIAGQYFRKSPVNIDVDDQQDLIIDVLNQVLTPATIKTLDSDRDPIKYFGGMFEMRMQSALKSWVTRRLREVKNRNDEMSDDEFFDTVDQRRNDHDEIDFVDLVKGLMKFLGAKPEAKYLIPMFTMLQKGYTNTEVAKELNVSPPIVTRYLQRMKDYILDYAQRTDNALLYELMSEYLGKRKHSLDSVAEQPDFLVKLFKEYKQRAGSVDDEPAREPAGEVLTITKTEALDAFSTKALSRMALDDKLTNDQLVQAAESFLGFMSGQDDLVEQADSVIGLRYLDSDTREV